MFEFRTPGYCGYAVRYSSFSDTRIAVGASQNYGLVGNGRLYILQLTARGIVPEQCFDTNDSVYDIAWSELNGNQIVTAGGDGTVKLFDISVDEHPIAQWKDHRREVYSVNWNLVSKDTFISGSWDGSIKLYSPDRPQPILTLPTHSCTYSTEFSPHSPSVISSVTADSHLRIFDLRVPASASNHLVSLIPIHGPAPTMGSHNPLRPRHLPSEGLTHDWNKYRDTVIATAGTDSIIRTFDIRNPKAGPVALLEGHKYAVRRLAWSPHHSDMLLSGSYDMTCKIWSDGNAMANYGGMGAPAAGRELGSMGAHTEFVAGVDWCMFGAVGWVASTAWDQRLLVWDARATVV